MLLYFLLITNILCGGQPRALTKEVYLKSGEEYDISDSSILFVAFTSHNWEGTATFDKEHVEKLEPPHKQIVYSGNRKVNIKITSKADVILQYSILNLEEIKEKYANINLCINKNCQSQNENSVIFSSYPIRTITNCQFLSADKQWVKEVNPFPNNYTLIGLYNELKETIQFVVNDTRLLTYSGILELNKDPKIIESPDFVPDNKIYFSSDVNTYCADVVIDSDVHISNLKSEFYSFIHIFATEKELLTINDRPEQIFPWMINKDYIVKYTSAPKPTHIMVADLSTTFNIYFVRGKGTYDISLFFENYKNNSYFFVPDNNFSIIYPGKIASTTMYSGLDGRYYGPTYFNIFTKEKITVESDSEIFTALMIGVHPANNSNGIFEVDHDLISIHHIKSFPAKHKIYNFINESLVIKGNCKVEFGDHEEQILEADKLVFIRYKEYINITTFNDSIEIIIRNSYLNLGITYYYYLGNSFLQTAGDMKNKTCDLKLNEIILSSLDKSEIIGFYKGDRLQKVKAQGSIYIYRSDFKKSLSFGVLSDEQTVDDSFMRAVLDKDKYIAFFEEMKPTKHEADFVYGGSIVRNLKTNETMRIIAPTYKSLIFIRNNESYQYTVNALINGKKLSYNGASNDQFIEKDNGFLELNIKALSDITLRVSVFVKYFDGKEKKTIFTNEVDKHYILPSDTHLFISTPMKSEVYPVSGVSYYANELGWNSYYTKKAVTNYNHGFWCNYDKCNISTARNSSMPWGKEDPITKEFLPCEHLCINGVDIVKKGSSDDNLMIIIIGVVGGVVLITVIIVTIVLCLKKKKSMTNENTTPLIT